MTNTHHAALKTVLAVIAFALVGIAASGYFGGEIPFAHLWSN